MYFTDSLIIYFLFTDLIRLRLLTIVLNAIFNNISVIIMAVSFIGGENHRPRRKSLTKIYHIMFYPVHLSIFWIQIHNVGGDMHTYR